MGLQHTVAQHLTNSVPAGPSATATTSSGGPPLGNRTLTIVTPPSGYYSSYLPTLAVGKPAGVMMLAAGAPDGNGDATTTVTPSDGAQAGVLSGP